MKNCLLSFVLVIFVVHSHAQNQSGFACGVDENQQPMTVDPNAINHCFNVQNIWDNCVTVWVRVNIHFFLDDNCDGGIQIIPGDDFVAAADGYQVAETLINNANNTLEAMENHHQWNSESWPPTVVTEATCIPSGLS